MSKAAVRPRAHWRIGIGVFSARPKLVMAIVAGLVVGAACFWSFPDLGASRSAIAGWDVFCLLYLALVFSVVADKGPDDIRARAAVEDQGQAVILALIVAACAVSVAAVGLELSLARHERGLVKALDIGGAILTVTASWWLMQTVYALHYAHEYYAADPETGKDSGGLAFPGDAPPDYWDFLHFAVVIGVAAQTADVAFTGKRLRRLGTAHSVIAFVFNTLIVALAINLVAGLF